MSSSSIDTYLAASVRSTSTFVLTVSLQAITNLEALSCKKTGKPFCFRILISLKAADSAEEMFDGNDWKLEEEINVLLTISIKSSTSSEAKGAFLSVFEYQGGLINGEDVDRSALGSSLMALLLNKKDHLILSFQSRISACRAAKSGGSRGVGVKLGPLDRREITPGETLISLRRRRGLKLSVEKETMFIGEDLRTDWP